MRYAAHGRESARRSMDGDRGRSGGCVGFFLLLVFAALERQVFLSSIFSAGVEHPVMVLVRREGGSNKVEPSRRSIPL